MESIYPNSLVKGACISYHPEYLAKEMADKLFDLLNDPNKFRFQKMYFYDDEKQEIYWRNNHRKSYWLGEHAQATQTENYSIMDQNTGTMVQIPTDYTYPYKFPSVVLELKQQIEKEFDCTFNSCLVGLFDDPKQKIGYHSDASHGLGDDPQIASITLGYAPRKFKLKAQKNSGYNDEAEVVLNHGDLVVMKDGANARYLHAVPKDSDCNDKNIRINLTFRNYQYSEKETEMTASDF